MNKENEPGLSVISFDEHVCTVCVLRVFWTQTALPATHKTIIVFADVRTLTGLIANNMET